MPIASITRKQAEELKTFCDQHNVDTFFFAKDHGAYMGATTGSQETGDFKNSIHYLKGIDPNIEKDDEDWYDTAVATFGGDDVGEILPVKWLEIFVDSPEHKHLKMFSIKITKRDITLVL